MRLTGEISPRHLALAGHFPGNPVVPGVVIMSRVCSAIAAQGAAVTAVPVVKFLAPLKPGEPFEINLEETGAGRYRFKVVRSGTLIATGIVHAAGA